MSGKAILCIDDETIVLDSLKEQLQQEFGDDVIIEIAEGGEEALEVFDELIEDGFKVPVVIADFIMPGMKGDEVLEKIHSSKPSAKTIMLTGQANVEGVSNAINNANLYRFISKPWDRDDLVLTVREALRSYDQEKTIFAQNEELRELNTNLEEKVELRTKELEELNVTKDKFFSIIAHDLKNPFNTLMGFSELLIENFSRFSPEKTLEFINIIFETSKNSFALLENLLEWSRAQTGSIKMDPAMIDLYALVEENIDFLKNPASKKQVTLHNKVASNTLVFADKNMIHTVLRNLISNAIKYTDSGDSITIDSKKEDSTIEICINDTGVGIKEENIPKLFRIDQNFSTIGTNKESGTGLGLILCKEFVTQNKGDIWVESVFGQGSTFKFTLPASKPEKT